MQTVWTRDDFQRRLDDAMTARGVTQVLLAKKLGVSQPTVSDWLSDKPEIKREPTFAQLAKIADILSIRPAMIAFGDDFEPMDDEEKDMLTIYRKLTETERASMRQMFAAITAGRTETKQPGKRTRKAAREILDVTVDHDTQTTALKLRMAPETAGEAPGHYAPIPKRTKRVNRRGELAVYPLAQGPAAGVVQIPRWESVAAGFGADLERSDEITYVRELPYWRGVHAVTVRGDSMEDTLFPGDLILVQPYPGEPIELPPRGEDPKNSKRQLMRFVPEDELFILSVNDAPPTVKRVQYQGEVDWKLQIVPDNGQDYRTYTISAHDKVVFYAKVMGIGDKRKGKLKYGARAKKG